jgi:aspartate-semialdehyde dehydrogenase
MTVIAIYDVSSLAGHEILTVLSERAQRGEVTIHGLTPQKQSGKPLSFGDEDIITQNIDSYDFTMADMLIVTNGAKDAQSYIEKAFKANIRVIDLSGQESAGNNHVSLPEPVAAMLSDILKPIHDEIGIKRVVLSTYQAVSSVGKDGMDELFNQSRKFFVHDALENLVFEKQIAFNVLPACGDFNNDGQTTEEARIIHDMHKHIAPDIAVSVTCVQVPVYLGFGVSVAIELNNPFTPKAARALWREAKGLIIIDRESEMEYVSPAEISGEDGIFISRIRADNAVENGLSFWCCADNIRALTAIKAVEAAGFTLASE